MGWMRLVPTCNTGVGGFGSGLGGLGGVGLIGLILNVAITLGLIVGLVLLIAWLWRRINSSRQVTATRQGPTATETPAKDILGVRYARGEINREQYQQMLTDLSR